MKCRVFLKRDLIISQIAVVTLKKSSGLRNKIKDAHTYDRAKVKPPTPLTLNVSPTQLFLPLTLVFVRYRMSIVY